MIDNAYKILGVSPNASDDDVKKAYRRLAKKYHPDANPGNEEQAAEKMAEVNAAYDKIINHRQGKDEDPFAGFGGRRATQDGPSEYTAARNFIANRRFGDAMNVLERMDEAGRDAQWYFLAGYAQVGLGNRAQGLEYASRAVQMDPDNPEYRRLLQMLQSGGNFYTGYGQGFAVPTAGGNWCCRLMIAQMLCRLFCRC